MLAVMDMLFCHLTFGNTIPFIKLIDDVQDFSRLSDIYYIVLIMFYF